MSQIGAPLGNTNAIKAKPWADAIRRALARRAADNGKDLNKLAETLLDKCLEGDLPALRELGDRLDGKPAQSLTVGGDDGPVELLMRWAEVSKS